MSSTHYASWLLSMTLAGVLVGGPATRHAKAPVLGSLVVSIDGFRNDRGHARVAVFDQPSGFPGQEHALRGTAAKIAGGRVEVRFDSLPVGIYAVAMYHDENDDGVLNKGLFGVPREGYGVSNNVVHARRAASFEEAEIRLEGELTTVEIHVHY